MSIIEEMGLTEPKSDPEELINEVLATDNISNPFFRVGMMKEMAKHYLILQQKLAAHEEAMSLTRELIAGGTDAELLKADQLLHAQLEEK